MAKSSALDKKGSKKRKLAAVVIHQEDEHDDAETQLMQEESAAKRQRGDRTKGAKDADDDEEELDTSKPSAVFKPTKGRDWTVSVALPGSFIANAHNFTEKTSLPGRIARALSVFSVDEVIIFDDAPSTLPSNISPSTIKAAKAKSKSTSKTASKAAVLAAVPPDDEPWQNPDQFLFHLLSYLECPPHLRTALFELHPNLSKAGQLPSLDMPHHMRSHEWCPYREGVTLPSPSNSTSTNETTLVNAGLPHPISLPVPIPPHTRVTLHFTAPTPPPSFPHLTPQDTKNLKVEAVAPDTPRENDGYYWGYTVRRAHSLSAVYTESPFEEGYDFSIGTSERGAPLSSILSPSSRAASSTTPSKPLPRNFKHLLLVFGGVTGLEPAVANDEELVKSGLSKETASELFDAWVDLVPGQGSRTIRTEEAVWLGLMGLWGALRGRSAGGE